MTKFGLQIKVAAGLLLAVAGSAGAQTYTNIPGGPDSNLPFSYFGNAPDPQGDSPAVGEVFSLTSASTLSSLSFYATDGSTPAVQLNVFQWSAKGPVGTALLTSGNAIDTVDSTTGITSFEFDNLGLNLASGTKYIAYLSSNDSTVTGIQLAETQTKADTSGFGLGLAYQSSIPGAGWSLSPNKGFLSLEYTANFAAAVPEPSTYAMLLVSLVGMGLTARRRQSKV